MGRFSLQYSALVQYVIPKVPHELSFQPFSLLVLNRTSFGHLTQSSTVLHCTAVHISLINFCALFKFFLVLGSSCYPNATQPPLQCTNLRYSSCVAPYLKTPHSACSLAANVTAKAGQHAKPMLSLFNSKLKLVSKTTLLFCKLPISTAVLLTVSNHNCCPCQH